MRIATLLLLLLAVSINASAGSMSDTLKDVDPETRASVVKEMTKSKRYQDTRRSRSNATANENATSNEEDRRAVNSTGGCTLDVGSTNATTQTRRPSPRRVVTVVTGNIIQVCK